MEWVADVVSRLGLPSARLERLKTAVAEAVLNAMKHGLLGSGHPYQAECPVCVRIILSDAPRAVTVQVVDQGTDGPITRPALPDLAAKLAGAQAPRGWGFFLIEKLVDKVRVAGDTSHHLIEVVLYVEGGSHDQPATG